MIPKSDRCLWWTGAQCSYNKNKCCPFYQKGCACKVCGNLKGQVKAKTKYERDESKDIYRMPMIKLDLGG